MTLMPPLTDQEAIDRHRAEVGWIFYCPVCRRPATEAPNMAGFGAARVARHLAAEHPYEAALLRIHLGRPGDVPSAPPDPFYPVDDGI